MGDYVGPGESNYTKYDQAVTERTCDWLTAAADDAAPWCLYVGLVAPHHPLVAPQKYYDLYPHDALPPDKLHPRDGYKQHPWLVKMADAMVGEEGWQDEAERRSAIAAYYGLTSYMDNNVGQIVAALRASGQYDNTTIIYSSDHGENLGVRGLWGKMNMYEESAAIPMIIAPAPNLKAAPRAICGTTASLLDVSETTLDHFEANLPGKRPGRSLYALADSADDTERAVFSEYHAIGAVSGAFMLRKGRWKLIEYVGFEPELFDLVADPEELSDLAQSKDYADVLKALRAEMRLICDPEAVNKQAFADQEELIRGYGGKAIAVTLGAPSSTPPPKT